MASALRHSGERRVREGILRMASGGFARSPHERRPTSVSLARSMNNIQKLIAAACALVITALPCWGQQQGGHREQTPASGTADAEFLQAADEVLAVMSKILSLPVKEPLKKSVRSRDEIREFLLRQMREDKDDTKRYADQKALEALGLIPKGYPLDQKLLALLTEQIAGLYDPREREFFIADWTQPAEQRMIMAHELTHALQDQYFQ